jgi:regulator of protease activity HflC (stomatin/prohibitin superfamily)
MALFVRDTTVYEWERGLLFTRGRFKRVLEPGRYRLSKRTAWVRKLDVREITETIPGQEVLTSDGVTVRVSLAATYAVADPHRAVSTSSDYRAGLYLVLQLALRDAVALLTFDDLFAKRSEIGGGLLGAALARAEELGLELKEVAVKDLMPAGELRRALAQVVLARKEGQAALEQTRAETASLRSLANAAKLVEQSPGLLQLRLLQQLASGGNNVILGFPQGSTVVPVPSSLDPRPSGDDGDPPPD